jgi:hypothetical protein
MHCEKNYVYFSFLSSSIEQLQNGTRVPKFAIDEGNQMRSTENLPGGDPRSSNCEQACLTGTNAGQIILCTAITGKETAGNLAKSGLASTPAEFDMR